MLRGIIKRFALVAGAAILAAACSQGGAPSSPAPTQQNPARQPTATPAAPPASSPEATPPGYY